jgi:outer membrane autotransporter protein
MLTGTGAMSNAAALINAMAGALPLAWFTELESVSQRMGELHFENREGKAGLSTWMRASGESLEFNHKATGTPFDERHFSASAGFDYKFRGTMHNIYTGAFFGYGESERDFSFAGDGSYESVFGGLYETLSTTSGWYVDGMLKANGFKNRFTAVSPAGVTASADYKNFSFGASLEIGKYCDIGYGWFVEPQLQAAYTYLVGKDYKTDAGMIVRMDDTTTAFGRAGFRFGRIIEFENAGLLHVYIKGHYTSQWTTGGRLYITTPSGQSRRYAPKIEGNNIGGGAGIAWLFTRRSQVYFDYTAADGYYYIKPWGLNLGFRLFW